ncbi:MAG: phospho-N-acetylmuramoyl-pentapeptide-transferase [Pseudanabaenaceae cyanobacterium bins.68]|nr:phospho-N-acetylmuramoyl-pentapeptide-transferase [Pseudanabaenaceae cyanobacterium bins.68]
MQPLNSSTPCEQVDRPQVWSGSVMGLLAGLATVLLVLLRDFYLDRAWNWAETLSLLLPLMVGVIAVALAGEIVIPWLRVLKAGQVIREDGPSAHLKKGGTPTMGGLFILAVSLPLSLVWAGFSASLSPNLLATVLVTLAFGLVGWLDDWQILLKKSNKGISPQTKLLLLGGAAISFCGWLIWYHPQLMELTLPLQIKWQIGWLFLPLALFVLLGSSNATNLTDGLDGLAAGTGAIALVALGILTSPDLEGIRLFAMILGGGYLGFLYHNCHPAKVFMGDTGSLALGGALGAIALIGNLNWALLIVGLIFVWEAICVILQVGYFKLTRRFKGEGLRLFKMAPFHHHLELSGWHETQVVGLFYLAAVLLAGGAIAIASYG